jgi:hypothetical protein
MKRTLFILALALVGCRHENPGVGGDNDGGIDTDGGYWEQDGMVCASQAAKVQALGADLLFLLDTSYSMDFNLKWDSVSKAMLSFVGDSRFDGVGVGLQYFPGRATCDVMDYANLAVPVQPLPGNSSALSTSIMAQRMSGGTPTVPAIQGVLQVATQNATANPNRKQVIVLATDGVPDNSCPADADMGSLPNSIASVVQLVGAAAMQSPPVTTFVVGVGSQLTALDAIAQAGGTQQALLVDTTTDVESAFANALDEIRKKALDCEFAIPPTDPGVVIDYTRVNVTFTEQTTQAFVFVGDASGCAQAPDTGWYYDNPTNPTKVVLCDQTCQRVRASADGEVDVVFGCAALVP